jgi:thiamine biosynthesis lipoprotein
MACLGRYMQIRGKASRLSPLPRKSGLRGLADACVLALLLSACTARAPLQSATLHTADGKVAVTLRAAPAARVPEALAAAQAVLTAQDRELHVVHASELTRINADLRAGRASAAPASVWRLLDRARGFAAASDGLLDPAVGGLVELWGFHTATFPLTSPPPDRQAIAAWMATRPRLDQLQVRDGRLAATNRAVQLDFNAVLEGDAAAGTAAALRGHGVDQALLVFGGDAFALAGGGSPPWSVPLRDPYGGELARVALGDGEAFFTSGNYDKFRTSADGERWGHVLDPRSGMPARGAAATAVLSDDPLLADAASTALMVAGPAGFERLVHSLGVGCAVMLTDENELLITRAMAARLDFARAPVPLLPPVDAGADCRAKR